MSLIVTQFGIYFNQASMKLLKNGALIILVLVILSSSIKNIVSQLGAIFEAKRINRELETEIERLKRENQVLERKIEYATSSAFLEQQARSMLGVGNSNDYWLVLPPEEKLAEKFTPRQEEIRSNSWWNRLKEWFTR
jgi:cell division protein FtsB